MAKGYIKLHRQIQDCWVWEKKPYSEGQAWIDLLLRASHKDVKIRFDGELVDVKIGSFITSILKLSDAWGWDRKKVTKFLNLLESDQMITKNSTTHGTTITIVKYEDFQFLGTTDGATDGQPLPQPRDNRSPQSNNYKNDKNENKNIYNVCFEEFWKHYPRKKEKKKAYAQYKARLNCGYSEDELLTACKNYAEECKGREERYIKMCASFLSVNEPFVDYLKKGETKSDRISEHIREVERAVEAIDESDTRSILDLI